MITKDNAAQWLPLVAAMAEGKTIQVRGELGGWFDVVSGCLTELNDGVVRYRIKPVPKRRPWKPEEAPKVAVYKVCDGDPEVGTLRDGFVFFGSRVSGESLRWVHNNAVHIAEDGSEHPCGAVEEGDGHA